MMMLTDLWFGLIVLFVAALPIMQDSVPMIGAHNIDHLVPVVRLDFDLAPAEAGRIDNGRFFVNADASLLAVVNRDNAVVVWNDDGTIVGMCAVRGGDGLPATFIEGAFGPGHMVVSIHTDGPESYYVSRCDVAAAEQMVWRSATILTDVWINGDTIWITDVDGQVLYVEGDDLQLMTADSPETDVESLIRIGRIAPPLAVTITEEGSVKRWDLARGQVTATARVTDGLPIYGHVTPDGRYLIWRDPPSTALRLLDFDTGTDREIVALGGTYIPFVFISPAGDTVIGVQIDEQPIVVAWDAVTGKRHDLGAFRTCSRPPDMVRLSADGTALVIGCDTGLEIWRVDEGRLP